MEAYPHCGGRCCLRVVRRCWERQGLAVSVRDMGGQPPPLWRPAAAPGHVGLDSASSRRSGAWDRAGAAPASAPFGRICSAAIGVLFGRPTRAPHEPRHPVMGQADAAPGQSRPHRQAGLLGRLRQQPAPRLRHLPNHPSSSNAVAARSRRSPERGAPSSSGARESPDSTTEQPHTASLRCGHALLVAHLRAWPSGPGRPAAAGLPTRHMRAGPAPPALRHLVPLLPK